MVIQVPDAVSAYQSASKLGKDGNPMKAAGNQAPDTFADMVRDGVQNMVDASHKSEKVSADYIAGKADMVDVVSSIRNAEMMLNTVVAVRDRVVSSIQEILRMPI